MTAICSTAIASRLTTTNLASVALVVMGIWPTPVVRLMVVSTNGTGPYPSLIDPTLGMKFSLPGQLRGPECRRVKQQSIALQRKLEPWFGSFDGGDVTELAVVLRVDGSLGSFGPEGVENIAIDESTLTCDVVVADKGWADLHDEEIAEILRTRVLQAIDACLRTAEIAYDAQVLETASY